ncbi:hypothetical protein H8356DRAFT_950729 [Neocallimastix lanati (nom. inval.)]|uniref:Uncharacterized protein n=1 Tax=Neocallimastix californiae TaxID=1754190 RepID=A0A1Y2AHS7_9FUNG|nr:hypothetical protein H8356DRAFT_950729 [Neocallimastix sp. JGI-2020a]ORY22153.1 hypothetical protein LY90DRAFT_515667 [Neocallimastix californiae]|eukprot:ORY22153.1 hypothetical protein LY90DRAFT_515667 [Neocallimastix californiae]
MDRENDNYSNAKIIQVSLRTIDEHKGIVKYTYERQDDRIDKIYKDYIESIIDKYIINEITDRLNLDKNINIITATSFNTSSETNTRATNETISSEETKYIIWNSLPKNFQFSVGYSDDNFTHYIPIVI